MKQLKNRLFLIFKRSGISAAALKTERPDLPSVLDIIFSNLDLVKKIRDLPSD